MSDRDPALRVGAPVCVPFYGLTHYGRVFDVQMGIVSYVTDDGVAFEADESEVTVLSPSIARRYGL